MLYVAEWNKEYKKTWSGTTFGLYSAGKEEMLIQNLCLTQPNKVSRFRFAMENYFKYGNFEKNMNFNQMYQISNSRKVTNIVNSDYKAERNILQIGDIANISESGIYQDLSLSFLIDLKNKDGEAFRYSGFQDLNEDELKMRMDLQKKRYNNAKYVFTMSKFLRDFLIERSDFSSEKVVHVGGGVNITNSAIEISKAKNRRRILFVGKDFYRKGGDLVVEAFSILKKKYYSDAELYIIGPNHIDKKFKRQNVHFLGELSARETEYYFGLCDIFCMPSRFEAYGLVFPEALVNGLPCIGRNKFEMPNFIDEGKTGYLIGNDDPWELASYMFTLLTNDKIFENVRNKEKYYKEKYSWKAVFKRIIKAYESA